MKEITNTIEQLLIVENSNRNMRKRQACLSVVWTPSFVHPLLWMSMHHSKEGALDLEHSGLV